MGRIEDYVKDSDRILRFIKDELEKIEKYFFLIATEKCISLSYNGTYERDMAWKTCNFGIMQQQKGLQYYYENENHLYRKSKMDLIP